QETEIPQEELVAKLQAISKTGYEERLFIRGDKTTKYGAAMEVMGLIQDAGYKNIALLSLPKQDQ
ncbi:biopolymer transporter ExbD, partial [Mesorhizobium sp.]|uniref:ExbD/TolR family protein n=1 Tax=Mesorhizobium sp. TaxID=1871066 RepID=UPI00120B7A1A